MLCARLIVVPLFCQITTMMGKPQRVDGWRICFRYW